MKRQLVLLLLTSVFMNEKLTAQTTHSAAEIVNKLGSFSLETYILLIIIFTQLIIILFLVNTLVQIIRGKVGAKLIVPISIKSKSRMETWFQKLNETVAIEDEDKIDLNHNYDGVRELDNKTPSWWSFGFYGSILFAAIYLYRVFVSGSMPTQLIELENEYAKAEKSKAQILLTTANNIDENTITMLDAKAISNGSMTFKANCVVCHGERGEGNVVGPNLTDDYWIHSGSVQDIFKTIKYGFPDKGMKSWKDDFSPLQIAELTSYVKTLQGTNPPNGKERQGEFYIDSSIVKSLTDSVK